MVVFIENNTRKELMSLFVFKKFSIVSNQLDSLRVINNYIDISECENLFKKYQAQVYGAQDDSLISCPSVRLKRISSDKYPADTLLLNINTLISLLEGLKYIQYLIINDYDSAVWWQRFIGRTRDYHPDTYKRAYGRTERVFQSILLEVNILALGLSKRLNSWVQTNIGLGVSELQSVSYDSNSEASFFKICEKLEMVKSINISYANMHDSGRSDDGNDILSRCREAYGQTQEHLISIGLDNKKLHEINKQATSFWRSQRYKAKLFYIRIDHKRLQNKYKSDLTQHWKLTNAVIMESRNSDRQLNWVFHFGTKNLYKEYQAELNAQLKNLAFVGMKQLLCNSNLIEYYNQYEQLVRAWVKRLPNEAQKSWWIFYEGLINPHYIDTDNWKNALFSLHKIIDISDLSCELIIKKIVKKYIKPSVNNIGHPAYHLVAQYTDTRYDFHGQVIVGHPGVDKNTDLELQLYESINESVFNSIDKLHSISLQRLVTPLSALVNLNIKSTDLRGMVDFIHREEFKPNNLDDLLKQLKFISTTSYASVYCQKQASILIDILSADNINDRYRHIDAYFHLKSSSTLLQQGIFSNNVDTMSDINSHHNEQINYEEISCVG